MIERRWKGGFFLSHKSRKIANDRRTENFRWKSDLLARRNFLQNTERLCLPAEDKWNAAAKSFAIQTARWV